MATPNCTVCFHAKRRQIDAYIKADSNYTPIMRWLREQGKKDTSVRVYNSKDPLRRHRENCLGLDPLASMTGGRKDERRVPGPPLDDSPVSDAEITERARAMLGGRLDELSAKELYTLVVEGLKTQRAEAAARAKMRDDGDGEDDDAKDDMRGALVALK